MNVPCYLLCLDPPSLPPSLPPLSLPSPSPSPSSLSSPQARAPHSPVLIVATHLDKLSMSRAIDLKHKYKERIKTLYAKSGYPHISG